MVHNAEKAIVEESHGEAPDKDGVADPQLAAESAQDDVDTPAGADGSPTPMPSLVESTLLEYDPVKVLATLETVEAEDRDDSCDDLSVSEDNTDSGPSSTRREASTADTAAGGGDDGASADEDTTEIHHESMSPLDAIVFTAKLERGRKRHPRSGSIAPAALLAEIRASSSDCRGTTVKKVRS